MFHWNIECEYLLVHESIHKVNYNRNIHYCCIKRCNHYDLKRKKIWILSVGRRGWTVLDLPSIFTLQNRNYLSGASCPYVILQFYYVIISVDLILSSFNLSGWDNSISVTAKFATSQTQWRWSSSVQRLLYLKNVFLIILAYFDNFLMIKLLLSRFIWPRTSV